MERPLKVLHFSTWDGEEGAAENARRIHRALRAAGVRSRMVVRYRRTADPDVVPVPGRLTETVALKLRRAVEIFRVGVTNPFTFHWEAPALDAARLREMAPEGADILFIHWTNWLLTADSIRILYDHFRCPILWFLNDFEPLTGGCSYPWDCRRYQTHCGLCPQLKSVRLEDRSWSSWEKKKSRLAGLPITFVTFSERMITEARLSALCAGWPAALVPACYDTQVFSPGDVEASRRKLGLPAGKKIVLFGSAHLSEKRKGMAALLEALRLVGQALDRDGASVRRDDVMLAIVGRKGRHLKALGPMPFESRYLGFLKDSADMAAAYRSADIFVNASTQDTGPLMPVESLLCGTPVAAFDLPFCRQVIRDGENGFLAPAGDVQGLAEAVLKLLTSAQPQSLRATARSSVVDRHSAAAATETYLRLFRALTEGLGAP